MMSARGAPLNIGLYPGAANTFQDIRGIVSISRTKSYTLLSDMSQTSATATIPERRRPRAPGDESVHATVYDAILDHRLPPGTRLSEDALGAAFGVSRTVVRRALFRLAQDRVVQIRPRRGAVVASPSVQEARDVFAARRVVEGALLRAPTAPPERHEVVTLRACLRAEDDARRRGDRAAAIRVSGDFHLRLAQLGNNRVLSEFLRELIARTSLIIALYEIPGRSNCAHEEHARLLDRVLQGERGAAVAMMDTHLAACEAGLDLRPRTRPADLRAVFADLINRAG